MAGLSFGDKKIDITVITPSRGRVRKLAAALTSMNYLESGENNVRYYVVYDNDDEETHEFCHKLKNEGFPIGFRRGPRFETMGGVVNEVAEYAKADVYLVINDDTLCMSLGWDKVISEACEKVPYGVFWWKNALPIETLYPIVTEKWRSVADGVFTDHYPYWFDDLCLIELWMMATDQEAIFLDCKLIDKPVHTHRMRDLRFWQQVYNKTRPMRVKKAAEIAEKLGLPKPRMLTHFASRIDEAFSGMTSERLREIEIGQGDINVTPDPSYLTVKARMNSFMNTNIGMGWCSP